VSRRTVIYEGQAAYRRGFGMADLENKIPIAPQTQFLLASLSEQFTMMGIMIARACYRKDSIRSKCAHL
jgi:CubicO group peptidase (beta-lactamase class C family)